MMFPDITVNIEEITTPSNDKLGKVFLFDFKTGRHVIRDGKPVECTELQAVKQWVELLLKTQLDKYPIYEDSYFGLSTNDIIGVKSNPLVMVQAILEEEIKEKCKNHVLIRAITNFSVERTNNGVTIGFNVVLKNGNAKGVSVIVK